MFTATKLNTSILTGLHLTVDGLCACCVFMLTPLLGASHALLLFVAYNVLAFLSQPFVGLWVDKTHSPRTVFNTAISLLTGGALASIISCAIPQHAAIPLLPYTATLLFGMGNALFHVYGGKSVAVQTGNDMRHLGVFVSSGAIGLVLGELLTSTIGLTLLVLCMVVLSFLLGKVEHTMPDLPTATKRHQPTSPTFTPLFLFVLLIVFIRSFIGKMLPAYEDNATYMALLFGVLAFVGKWAGGFLGKKWGTGTILTITLLASGVCFLLSGMHFAFGLAMTLTINLTMPLTLYLANQQMPHHEGFAFGMLAAMLIPGTALGMLCSHWFIVTPLLYALIATIVIEVAVLLAIGEQRWQVLGMSLVMNVLTNLPLNIFLLSHPTLHTSLSAQILLECGVVAVESLLYLLVLHNGRKAFCYAMLCNAISYLIGLLYTYL